jgi:exo-beta-1,3-glucanase (GH17 family)
MSDFMTTIRSHALLPLLATLLCLLARAETVQAKGSFPPKESPFIVRLIQTTIDNQWIGNAISYGPYRDGQEPGAKAPSKAEMAEDLQLISKHWRLLRIYGTSHCGRELLEVVREQKLSLKVMVGAWIAPEVVDDGDSLLVDKEAIQANEREVAVAIELANEFPEIVWAISVGNETQVNWSSHKVPSELLIGFLRQVRANTGVPVTIADDFLFWLEDTSHKIAEEIDFLVMHVHPAWHAQEADNGLGFVEEQYEAVRKLHADRLVVIGETGWATCKNPTGREVEFVRGKMGEAEQQLVYRELSDWARKRKVPIFMFEAFDENWKGDADPNEVEKHWGLFRADRTPKPAMQRAVKEQ